MDKKGIKCSNYKNPCGNVNIVRGACRRSSGWACSGSSLLLFSILWNKSGRELGNCNERLISGKLGL
jgi:hypothetical protein